MAMITYEQAHSELREAGEAFDRLTSAVGLAEVDRAWREFLSALERSWTKVHARLKHHPRYPAWIASHETVRKRDPLLAYVRTARSAAEHSLGAVTRDADTDPFQAHLARLPSIKNQGVTFHPPTSHLGQPVDPRNIVEVARKALTWYEQFVRAAENEYFST